MAIGAVASAAGQLGRPQQPGFAAAQSISNLEEGQTLNEMRWLGNAGIQTAFLGLVAKPLSTAKKVPEPEPSYEVQWQVFAVLFTCLFPPH